MATIGQALTAPEAGWKRYDDAETNVSYTSEWAAVGNSLCYNGACHQVGSIVAGKTACASFNFVGSKIRFISYASPYYGEKAYISIDGTEYSYKTNGSAGAQALLFEMIGLPLMEHSVKIYQKEGWAPTLGLVFDAIDIDDTGTIKPYTSNVTPTILAPTNLAAITGDTQVTLSWAAVTGATGYNVKRSTTTGGPYAIVGVNVSTPNFIDTTVINGKTYYYVVTALNATAESTNSNEASATPVASSKSLLRVTMNDSSEREYEVLAVEIDAFVSWYNSAISAGKPCYMFNKNVGSQNSKEYLAFEKIISFEIIPLAK